MIDENKIPDVRGYVSSQVFDVVRILDEDESRRHRDRLKRSLTSRKKSNI